MNFFKGFKEGFQYLPKFITMIINAILLTIVYFVGVGLTALMAKIAGKRFLELKTDKGKKSYWKDYNLGKEPKENYYRQF
jgi:hypothetical protein